jgi:hypothetical protein
MPLGGCGDDTVSVVVDAGAVVPLGGGMVWVGIEAEVDSVGKGAGGVSVAGSGVSVTAEGAQAANIKSTSKGAILVFISSLLFMGVFSHKPTIMCGSIS